jgi:hypothetical protein
MRMVDKSMVSIHETRGNPNSFQMSMQSTQTSSPCNSSGHVEHVDGSRKPCQESMQNIQNMYNKNVRGGISHHSDGSCKPCWRNLQQVFRKRVQMEVLVLGVEQPKGDIKRQKDDNHHIEEGRSR